MRKANISILGLLVLFTLGKVGNSLAQDVPLYPSPNGRFTVSVNYGNYNINACYTITDNIDGRVNNSVEASPPLLKLKWGSDSKTFVAVQHVAGGSYALLVRHTHDAWKPFGMAGIADGHHDCSVVGVFIGTDIVRMKFKFIHEDEHRMYDSFGLYSCGVKIVSGKVFDQKIRKLTESAFEAMKDFDAPPRKTSAL